MIARLLIILTLLIFSFVSHAQWQEIGFGTGLAQGHNDLHFTSIDTGYVVGGQFVNEELSGYVLRTYNGGESWDTTYVQNKVFRAIHFPTTDTGYIAYIENVRLGILRTIDGGDSWVTIADSIVVTNPPSLDLTFFNNQRGLVSMGGASYLTDDSGITWSFQTGNPVGGTGDIDSDGQWFAGTGGVNLVVYSNDAAESYETEVLTNGATGSDVSLLQDKVALSFLGGFGGDLGYPYFNFARVIIGSLTELSFSIQDLPSLNMINDIDYVNNSIICGIALPFESNGPKFIKSIDSGQSWHKQGVTEGSLNYQLLQKNLFCVNDTVWYAASGKVIYKTTNGGGPLLEPIESILLNFENPVYRLEFNIFPNPSRGIVTLEFEKPVRRLTIFDALGKVVYQESAQYQSQLQIYLGHLPKGLYLVQVEGKGGVGSRKVVLE